MKESVKGSWNNERGHVIDIMATVLDATGVTYPKTFRGRNLAPLAGTSLLPTFQGQPLAARDLFIEHEGNRAMFRGKWKLVTKNFSRGATICPRKSWSFTTWTRTRSR